jgi:hypothetical protein
MYYEKYHIYDDGVEIMIPAFIKKTETLVAEQHLWLSEDGKTIISITRDGAKLTEDEIDSRLEEYYKGFIRDITHFECFHVKKRKICGRPYGEIRYRSRMMGYDFFNIFILGEYEGREIITTIQCMENDNEYNIRVFENIADSLRVLRKPDNHVGEDDE